VSLETAVEVADVGNEARQFFAAWTGPVFIYLRNAALSAL
jgi:hypothetical protein